MTNLLVRICAPIAFCALCFGAEPSQAKAQSSAPAPLTGFPFTDEDLTYSVNWPSGINLGEAHLHAKHAGPKWNFSFTLDAGVPGFQVKDVYHGESTAEFCSVSFDRNTLHGARKTEEKETIDRNRGIATRVTKGDGGTSDIAVPDCVKDALTFLFFAREELGQGRVPAAQKILFGGLYQMTLAYAGGPIIPIAGKQVQSDEIVCTVKGPASEFKFEMYFARDPARTPLLVKVPLAMGAFSMELVH
jgi:Protein of unknown function (DUF3108)